jgi:hypothetical protein
MALANEDIQRIGEYVKPWLREVVTAVVPAQSAGTPTQLLERMVRVEEELKSQRELMIDRFEAMDRRFEDLRDAMDKRFETMDARFADARDASDKRFEAMDKRFEAMDRRFDDVQQSIRTTQWLIGLVLIALTASVTVFGFLG